MARNSEAAASAGKIARLRVRAIRSDEGEFRNFPGRQRDDFPELNSGLHDQRHTQVVFEQVLDGCKARPPSAVRPPRRGRYSAAPTKASRKDRALCWVRPRYGSEWQESEAPIPRSSTPEESGDREETCARLFAATCRRWPCQHRAIEPRQARRGEERLH